MAKRLVELAMWCSIFCSIIILSFRLMVPQKLMTPQTFIPLGLTAVLVVLNWIVCRKKQEED